MGLTHAEAATGWSGWLGLLRRSSTGWSDHPKSGTSEHPVRPEPHARWRWVGIDWEPSLVGVVEAKLSRRFSAFHGVCCRVCWRADNDVKARFLGRADEVINDAPPPSVPAHISRARAGRPGHSAWPLQERRRCPGELKRSPSRSSASARAGLLRRGRCRSAIEAA
jgi:hypothetical protein